VDPRETRAALARAAGPLSPGRFRVLVFEADATTRCTDFDSLAEARSYADDAASETADGIVLSFVFDDRLSEVAEGQHYSRAR